MIHVPEDPLRNENLYDRKKHHRSEQKNTNTNRKKFNFLHPIQNLVSEEKKKLF